jgi:maleylpyruvate isomerase
VRIALNLKGLPYDYAPVHLVRDGGEQLRPDHLARNPMGQVPVLEVVAEGETVQLTQSLAIVLYLEARWPEPPLLPDDAAGIARAWALAEIVNSGIQPLQNIGVIRRLAEAGVDTDAWCRDAIAKGLHALEALVRDDTSAFMVGDRPGVADVCLVPQLYNARRFGVDLQPYPRLLAIEARCVELPAFVSAHPDRQPDAP